MTSARRRLTPIPFNQVTFEDSFWVPRIETNRTETLPHIYRMLQETGRISAFDLNFKRPVPTPIVYIFGDSDAAKWIEAASYALAVHPDPHLQALLDSVVDQVISAQQPDGYLNTHFTVTQPEMRWKNLRDWHEMYCAGHLIEAAVAHAGATGDPRLLRALSRYADHIDATFGPEPGKLRGYCGHPEIELALVRLYHATQNPRYLDLAKYFIDERGAQPHYYDIEARQRGDDPANFWARSYEYCQAHVPIRQQEKVVGHAVRAMYLFSAAADLAHETDDLSLLHTCYRLWENLVTRRMYLTGGIGPSRDNEGFTLDYDLPDETAYAETCATIGLMMWNHRLLQFTGAAKFADALERGLYNGFLSGVSLDGRHFLYENPLSSAGDRHRVEWFNCPCCPPNVARNLASVGNYFYSSASADLWVHLFAASTLTLELGGVPLQLRLHTAYPWQGGVEIEVNPEKPVSFTLHLRLPGWCKHFSVDVNGHSLLLAPDAQGYLVINWQWQAGDRLSYHMEMPIQPVFANPAVRHLEGRLALQRGPIVYCLEGIDHNGIILDRISVSAPQVAQDFTAEHRPDLLGGVTVIHGKGMLIEDAGWGDELYRSVPPARKAIDLMAVPYCTWDNRQPGEMRVWLRSG